MSTNNEERITTWKECQKYMEEKAIKAIQKHDYKSARAYLNDAQTAKARIKYLEK